MGATTAMETTHQHPCIQITKNVSRLQVIAIINKAKTRLHQRRRDHREAPVTRDQLSKQMELQCCANIPSINHYRSQHSPAMGTSLQGISQHRSHHLKAAPSPLHKPAKNKQSMAKDNTSNQLSGPAGVEQIPTQPLKERPYQHPIKNAGQNPYSSSARALAGAAAHPHQNSFATHCKSKVETRQATPEIQPQAPGSSKPPTPAPGWAEHPTTNLGIQARLLSPNNHTKNSAKRVQHQRAN
ncbi:hypothetical protein Nepgr_002664 [Nepenthes gracilis]|uniref:Uncharacterized protein n=1 Tax=Nepenthes gracilis TaxID=150966 RepID=A0AAD3P448_NEPGR|nr:hypothetical protein Nepgr_002664 [Nepenthes gracilis]